MESQTALISFKGAQYQLSIKASRIPENSFLQISLSSTPGHGRKHAEYFQEFTPEYVENMTLKTGNFKKFSLFVEMLFSGLEKRSGDTVSLDILTMKDLQKATSSNKADAVADRDGLDAKLYLIVTYAVAFDRVHYPLPLLLQDEKNYADLYSKYLQVEKERLDTIQELSSVMRENDRLKHSIKSSNPPKDSTKFILSDGEYKDLLAQMDRIKRDLSKSTFECKHHRIHEEMITILHQLSRKLKNSQELEGRISKTTSKTRSATRPLSSSGQSLAPAKSTPRSSSLSKTQSAYGSFGPAPKKTYTVIKSEPIEKPARSRSKKATAPASREASRSPFRRFDPTRYVLEKEAKLEERRSRSAVGSRTSLAASRSSSLIDSARNSISYQRTPSVGSDDSRRGGRKNVQGSLSKERPSSGKSRPRVEPSSGSPKSRRFDQGFRRRRDDGEGEVSAPHREVLVDREKLARSRSRQPIREREPDPDADRIDERLAKLQQYLQTVLK